MATIAEMFAEVEKLNGEVKGIFDQAGDDELDSQTWQKVKDNNKEIERIEGLIKARQEQDAVRKAAAERGRLPTPRDGSPDRQERQQNPKGASAKSVGQFVLEGADFKTWRERIAANGAVSRAQFGNSPAVQLTGGIKALITGASVTSAGALVDPEFLGLRDMGTFMRPLTIRDLITVGSTDSDAVDYVRMGAVTNNAAPVAEATDVSGSSGAKPQSDLALAVVSETVKTIAHWVAATRRALADAGQIRTVIDSFLRYGLEEELEDQILNGNGSGENFTGIFNTSGTSTQAYDTSLLTTTRKARTKVQTQGRAVPTAYVMHPLNWEAMDLLQDAEQRYYFGGPSVLGNARLWGLPVVESEAMIQGESMVADWRLAVLWDRMIAQILVSDSHSDFFIRNLIAILAELRAAFGVLRPAAFVETDMTP